MDIKNALLKARSKATCNRIVRYVGQDKQRFAELIDLFFNGDKVVSQWAGWPMSYCVQHHPELELGAVTFRCNV